MCNVSPSRVLNGKYREGQNGQFFGGWLSLRQSGCVSFGDVLWLSNGESVVAVVSAHPTRWCVPSVGSCSLGWRQSLATVAALPSPNKAYLELKWVGKLCPILCNLLSRFIMLLRILVIVGELTPGHRDVYFVGSPKGTCRGNTGRSFVRPHFSPWVIMFSGW